MSVVYKAKKRERVISSSHEDITIRICPMPHGENIADNMYRHATGHNGLPECDQLQRLTRARLSMLNEISLYRVNQ